MSNSPSEKAAAAVGIAMGQAADPDRLAVGESFDRRQLGLAHRIAPISITDILVTETAR